MTKKIAIALVALTSFCSTTEAQETSTKELNLPIIQTKYTADPAPYVHGDTIYLFTTHDEDGAEGFKMKDWLLYTSTDMVNWQDHGAVASLRDFKWYKGDNGAWAEQVIERNGKWYMYCPIHGHGIGVLVANSPYGPYSDPLGEPLVWQKEHWDDIDPTVWIDDDGQAYMYWGNPSTYYVKLNEDMISYNGDIVKLPKIKDYQEGPWLWSRKNEQGKKKWYLAFASTCCPEGIGYAMSDSPTGPWEYKGHIMNHTISTRGNHPGIIDYKGRSYCFGLNYDVYRLQTSRHAEQRSVSAAEMQYNADGTIQELPYFLECTLRQLGTFNPYRRVEAETMAWGYGLKTTRENPSGPWNPTLFVTDIDDGEYILLKGVDMGNGASSLTVSCASHLFGGILEVRLDTPNGTRVGSIVIPNTRDQFREFTTSIQGAQGIHDLYFVFTSNSQQKQNLFNFDWWEMKQ
ncbi:MAG: family 43 glycosylhydrolase [Bacteroidaceae bacterium]|nr:family 43 glycosylhydrolase [Bacteroidaceae bacterium]